MIDPDLISKLEYGAAILGMINIALLIFRTVWNFPFGIASVGLATFVYWEERLYTEAGLQIFFVGAQIWGWWLWLKLGGEDSRVPVRWLDGPSRAVWTLVTLALSLNLGWVMHKFTNATLPYADSAITGASIAAQILLGFRRIENWVVWIAVDVGSVVLLINRELYAMAVLYAAMLVMSLIGLREWIQVEQREPSPA